MPLAHVNRRAGFACQGTEEWARHRPLVDFDAGYTVRLARLGAFRRLLPRLVGISLSLPQKSFGMCPLGSGKVLWKTELNPPPAWPDTQAIAI
jgi:hypothetical protein